MSTVKAHVFTHNVELVVLSTFAFPSVAGLAIDVRYTFQQHNLFNALFQVCFSHIRDAKTTNFVCCFMPSKHQNIPTSRERDAQKAKNTFYLHETAKTG
jgi:putative lipase involved disintegration of autophagic bodies